MVTVTEAAQAKKPADKRRGRLAVLLDTLPVDLRGDIEQSILDHQRTVGGRRRFACHPAAIAEVLIERNLVPADGTPVTVAEIKHFRISHTYRNGSRR